MKKGPLIAAVVVIGLTVALNRLVPVSGRYRPHGERISRKIPYTLGEWKADRDLPASEEAKRILGTDDILHRLYRRPNDSGDVLLSLIFSAGHRHSMHPPEVCYQAQGFKLVKRSRIELPHQTEATVLRLSGNDGETLVNYWFSSEGKETASYMFHQVHLMINQIFFSKQPSVLLRLSTRITRHNVDAAQARLTAFAEEAIPILRRQLSILESNNTGGSPPGGERPTR